jgi:leucyl aminopeptidase
MLSLRLSNQPLEQQAAQALAFFVTQDQSLEQQLQGAAVFYPPLLTALKQASFEGKTGKVISFTGFDADKQPKYIIIAGLGPKEKISIECYRRALGSIVRVIEKQRLATVAFSLPEASLFNETEQFVAQETAIAVSMAHYHFDEYITNPEKKFVPLECFVCVTSSQQEKAQQGFDRAAIIADAVTKARLWCDTPPSTLTPSQLAAKARAIGDTHKNINVTIYGQKAIADMGMGGIIGVSRGSVQEGQFVTMEYKATTPTDQTIALVGKGVTFDSGGLSLKPSQYMETMKDDMAGAAVVIATMEAIARLKPSVNVVACVPIVENLPDGNAQKPGDIITFYNGKTAEVKDTDAEGRLILADALAYAVKNYKPTAIIDLATLTGACVIALGHFYAGLLSDQENLVDHIEKAAAMSGDRVWQLPLDNDFKASIVSDIADMSNIGKPSYMAGTITAAFFLRNFVDDTPWAHLDIAGTAFNVPDMSYYRSGATGFGVRLLVQLLTHWQAL